MFDQRNLPATLEAVRVEHAPGALVVDAARDFETLDPAVAESIGPMVDGIDPTAYPSDWLPEEAPAELYRFADTAFVIGLPGDGGVVWTNQTDPPTVFLKPRLQGSPDAFVDFLLAEALVEAGLGVPERFIEFSGNSYRELAAAVPLAPGGTYQLAVALYDAYVGLRTRDIFEGWADDVPELHAAWREAGGHLEPRLEVLPREVAAGRTDIADAAELACNAVKHDLTLPPPFAALDTPAYRDHGAPYAVEWATRTVGTFDDPVSTED